MGRAVPQLPDSAEELAWREHAECGGNPGPFYPVGREGEFARRVREEKAKRFCASCIVKDECLQYALDHDEREGIWGGLTENERRARQRAAIKMGRLLNARQNFRIDGVR